MGRVDEVDVVDAVDRVDDMDAIDKESIPYCMICSRLNDILSIE